MFSVILPVYNGSKFVDNAVKSVLAQTCTDWELIIVDDGSSDNTLDVLRKYDDNEKIHITSQENGGVSVARNNAARMAKGDYLVFLDADDVWHEDHLYVMKKLCEKYSDAGLYGTFTRVELVNGETIEECEFFKNRDEDVYLKDFFYEYNLDKSAKMFTVITTCIRTDAFVKAGGFPVGCKIGEDLELSLRVAAYYPVVLSKKATATYKKENSTATKARSFDPDWGFFEGVKKLYEDEEIPKEKRENIKRVMEWFSMRRCRHYLIEGERKKAIRVYRLMDKKAVGIKDSTINLLLLMMPTALIRKLFEVRWRGQA